MNTNETINLLKNHVSVRKFTDEPVSRETVDTIVQCAQMAPTSSHYQAYTIIEVQDATKREILAKASGGQPWVVSAPLVLLFCADLHRGKEYFSNIDADVLGNVESFTIATADTALACQKALIAAQALGLGGVIVGGIRNDIPVLHETFGLPELVAPLFALCLGYPAAVPGIKPRLPQNEVHKIDFYDERQTPDLINSYNKTIKEYYTTRTNGKVQNTWSEHCGELLMDKTREHVGDDLRQIGFLQR